MIFFKLNHKQLKYKSHVPSRIHQLKVPIIQKSSSLHKISSKPKQIGLQAMLVKKIRK
ncbi:hypothetical protein Hanom_Chr12g01161801 [Helianthus anomalus]